MNWRGGRARVVVPALLVLAVVAPGGAASTAGAGGPADCTVPQPPASGGAMPGKAAAPPLQYGVTAGPGPDTVRLLAQVRPPRTSFGVKNYIGPAEPPALSQPVVAGLHRLARLGYKINLNINDEVLPYGGTSAPPSPAQFIDYVRKVVAENGSWLAGVEITNEPNLPLPSSSDGANPDIVTDLVQGVIAAKTTARARHFRVQVGFNYVFSYDAPDDLQFWQRLKAAATPEFFRDVDWMGLHTYPNYVSMDTPVNDTIDYEEQQGLATGRCWASWLGFPRSLPIDISEVGYPTYLGTSEYAAQADYWNRVLRVVNADRAEYGIRSVDVFYLQDGTSSAFGIFDAAGHAKPAAPVLRRWFASSH